MFTYKNKRYLRFAITNDMMYFEALLGIKFVQTPAEAGITAESTRLALGHALHRCSADVLEDLAI